MAHPTSEAHEVCNAFAFDSKQKAEEFAASLPELLPPVLLYGADDKLRWVVVAKKTCDICSTPIPASRCDQPDCQECRARRANFCSPACHDWWQANWKTELARIGIEPRVAEIA